MSYTSNKTTGSRSTGLIVVVVLHIVLIYGLSTGLASKATKEAVVLLQVALDDKPEEVKPDEAPPPPPPADIPPPPVDQVIIPELSMQVDVPQNYSPPTQVVQTAKPVAVAAMTPAQMPKKPWPAPEYPPASQRLGEEGVVQLKLYVNEEGRVSEAQVGESSGFPRLDEAAVKQAKRVGRLVPCMQGDKPMACWYVMNYRWVLPK